MKCACCIYWKQLERTVGSCHLEPQTKEKFSDSFCSHFVESKPPNRGLRDEEKKEEK